MIQQIPRFNETDSTQLKNRWRNDQLKRLTLTSAEGATVGASRGRADVAIWHTAMVQGFRIPGKSQRKGKQISSLVKKIAHILLLQRWDPHCTHRQDTHTHSLEPAQDKFNDKLMVLLEIFWVFWKAATVLRVNIFYTRKTCRRNTRRYRLRWLDEARL